MTDSRELARPNGGAVAQAQSSDSGQLLQIIIAAAKDPAVDADKMVAMANLATSLQDRERLSQFNRDKNAAIMEMPVITKDGLIVINDKQGNFVRNQGRFAKWDDIDRVIRPILSRHNLALSFDVAERETGGVTVAPILTHANGHTERGQAMPLPADLSGAKNANQAIGSAVSYGKRYTACAMLNLVTEGVDNDGNLAAGSVVSLPYERQDLVLKDARAAKEQGRYEDWFYSEATPKDRAWLVATGHHEEFGGKALPTPVAPEPVVVSSSRADPPPPPPLSQPPPTTAERRRASPREWTDGFKATVETIRDGDALDQFVDDKRELLARLQNSNKGLWEECDTAIRNQREAIEDGRLV